MYNIRILNNIAPEGLARLPSTHYTMEAAAGPPHGILLRSASLHDAPIPPGLLAVARAGAGVNNIPVQTLTARGVAVFNTPGANANAVKELVMAGMLLACRNIGPALEFARALHGDDDAVHDAVEGAKKRFAGFELPGRTLGVIGLGAIGVEVANAAVSLGMRVIGYDPKITVQRAWQMSAAVTRAASVDEVVAAADFLTVHVPLAEGTRHLIDADRLRLARRGLVLLNFARAGIIDDAAAVAALDDGHVYAYVCDFPSTALLGHPRAVTLPHLGASTREAEVNCAIMAADQLRDYLENGNVTHSVNLPAVTLPRAGAARLAVVHLNRPDRVGQISHLLGAAGLNIAHMVNESRGELACTLIDVESRLDQAVVADVAGIDGVLRVRAL